MHHPVMWPAEQRQVGQRRRAASRPPDQVMPVAPDGRPRATREDAVPVACFERPPRRRRQRPAGVVELVLELALAGNPADGTVAGIALDGLRRYRAATLELTRRRAPGPGQGVEAGADDQLRARACAIALAAGAPLPAEFHERVDAALAVVPGVVLDRLHERLQRRAQGRATLNVEHAVEPNQPIDRLADVEIAPLIGPVRLRQRAGGIDPVLEVLRHRGELARVHRLGRLEQVRLFLAHCRGPHMFRGAGQDGDVLVANVAVGERRPGPGQLLELARDLHPLHGGAAREFAFPAQPGRQRERAVGFVLARLVETAYATREDGFQWINAGFPYLDQRVAKCLAVRVPNTDCNGLDAGPQGLHGRFQTAGSRRSLVYHGHALSVNHGCDRCLSITQRSRQLSLRRRARYRLTRRACGRCRSAGSAPGPAFRTAAWPITDAGGTSPGARVTVPRRRAPCAPARPAPSPGPPCCRRRRSHWSGTAPGSRSPPAMGRAPALAVSRPRSR